MNNKYRFKIEFELERESPTDAVQELEMLKDFLEILGAKELKTEIEEE